jgi:hypothetical protein
MPLAFAGMSRKKSHVDAMSVDAMSMYWFRPKRYGYGVTPTTWQGWAITLATAAVICASSTLVVFGATHPWLFILIPVNIVAIAVLLIVSRRKTDGAWRWRWGGR